MQGIDHLLTTAAETTPTASSPGEGAWQRVLDQMIAFAAVSAEDSSGELVETGLEVYQQFPGTYSTSLFLIDPSSFDLSHVRTLPQSAEQEIGALFPLLIEHGAVARALTAGRSLLPLHAPQGRPSSGTSSEGSLSHSAEHVSTGLSPKLDVCWHDAPTHQASLWALSASSQTLGLVITLRRLEASRFEHGLHRLCTLHGHIFAHRLANAQLLRQLRSERSLLEQRVAVRTLGLEQARRELKASADQLVIAKEAAERANRLKTSFLAGISHDLRTPIHGILGMLALTMERPLEAEQSGHLETARQCASSLLSLIDELIEMARIESGPPSMQRAPFNLRDLAELSVDTVAPLAHQKRLEVIGVVDPSLPEQLLGDERSLRHILVNLLGNAIKFTEKGEVILRIEVSEDLTQDSATGSTGSPPVPTPGVSRRIRFSVSDTGMGIPAQAMDRIFERFEQADTDIAPRFGGSGLGLAICQELCVRQGSRMKVESAVGQGSRFYFDLEMAAAEPSEPATRLRLSSRALVVAQSATLRESIVHTLTGWGAGIRAASSLKEALASQSGGRRRGSLGDHVLVEWEVLADVPAADLEAFWELTKGLSLVAMVRAGQEERLHHLEKGVKVLTLRRPVRRLELYRLLAEPMTRAGPTPGGRLEVSSPGREGARILLVDDNPVNLRIASSMLKKWGMVVETAETGEGTLERLRQSSYDLVLLDVQLPDMDGKDVARRIRQEPSWKSLPVVGLSANAFEEEREASLAAGMDDYLTKPIERGAMSSCLARWLSAGPMT